jgi:spore coat polysaccharide biosynthesis predicted glycosyltransferase SpsG
VQNKYVFITEVSEHSGLGHFTRSMSVVREINALIRDSAVLLVKSSFSLQRISCNIDNNIVFVDPSFLSSYIRSIDYSHKIVIDVLSWSFFRESLQYLCANFQTISLSPVSDVNRLVDMIISRGYCADYPETKQIHGLEYSVVRDGVIKTNKVIKKNSRTNKRDIVGMVMGGTDPENMTLKL